MAIRKKALGSNKISRPPQLADAPGRGETGHEPLPQTMRGRRVWTGADEELVLRLAEGVRLASTQGGADVSQLSDEEFLKLVAS